MRHDCLCWGWLWRKNDNVVFGNHDNWVEPGLGSRVVRDFPMLHDVNNGGAWLERQGQRLRIGGVGDLWTDKQDLSRALGDCRNDEVCILLSHNPDYAEQLRDKRVGLVLSGHTHGGQIVLPFFGAPLIPSRYGRKYQQGLVRAPHTQVFVSRGLGVVGLPFRFRCPPEIDLLDLKAA